MVDCCPPRRQRRDAPGPGQQYARRLNIAVRSTIIRKINGTVLTGERELIGDPDRNSDPHIGAQVNMIARKDAFVAIANRVAAGFAPLGWQTPDGSDPKDFWKILRDDAARGLRAVYEVPAAKGFTVGDITIHGLPIAFGAQIVDFITIKLVGQAAGIGKNVVPPDHGDQCAVLFQYNARLAQVVRRLDWGAPSVHIDDDGCNFLATALLHLSRRHLAARTEIGSNLDRDQTFDCGGWRQRVCRRCRIRKPNFRPGCRLLWPQSRSSVSCDELTG
jgi:hypothetical protein